MKKLYIEDNLHKKLKMISSEREITLKKLANEVVKEYLEKRKEKK